MGRYKTIIGPSLKARTLDNQKAEAAIGARGLNRVTALDMPRGVRITGNRAGRGRRNLSGFHATMPVCST